MLSVPGVVCNNCAIAETCPKFQENHACYFDESLEGLSSRDESNLIPTLELIADTHKKRAFRGLILENAQGGQLDPNVSRQLELAASSALRVAELKRPVVQQQPTQSLSIVAQQTGGGDGGGERPGGLIQMLMEKVLAKPPSPPPAAVAPPIDVETEE
jgi:hypothetical protein